MCLSSDSPALRWPALDQPRKTSLPPGQAASADCHALPQGPPSLMRRRQGRHVQLEIVASFGAAVSIGGSWRGWPALWPHAAPQSPVTAVPEALLPRAACRLPALQAAPPAACSMGNSGTQTRTDYGTFSGSFRQRELGVCLQPLGSQQSFYLYFGQHSQQVI